MNSSGLWLGHFVHWIVRIPTLPRSREPTPHLARGAVFFPKEIASLVCVRNLKKKKVAQTLRRSEEKRAVGVCARRERAQDGSLGSCNI